MRSELLSSGHWVFIVIAANVAASVTIFFAIGTPCTGTAHAGIFCDKFSNEVTKLATSLGLR
jgi:hypothetical protein